MNKIIKIFLVLLLILLGVGIILFYFGMPLKILPQITFFTDKVGGIPFEGGCLNICKGETKLLLCGKEDTTFNTFGKKCYYLCKGNFSNTCHRN